MNRIALAFSPLRDASPRDIVAWSQRAEALGYEAVFVPESYCDSLAYALAVALATTRLRVGTAITNIYLRQPTLLAAEAAAVQEFSGGRLLLGVGVGHRAVNEPLGIDMSDPLGKTREVIATLRAAWTKGPHQPRPAVPPPRPEHRRRQHAGEEEQRGAGADATLGAVTGQRHRQAAAAQQPAGHEHESELPPATGERAPLSPDPRGPRPWAAGGWQEQQDQGHGADRGDEAADDLGVSRQRDQ
jgi:alkanesulfonate monooxygenase SsuD/methylene tetrahydromethanopterin reductase-like flavin-dependent oxidoreductase (luciferase family)